MAAASGSKRAGIKTRRSSKHATYHAAQFMVTERNKARRATKRRKKLEMWHELGVKKNGQLVKQPATKETP